MLTVASFTRHGHGSVRPYIHGPVNLPEFVRAVFEAQELERHEFGPQSFHVEMQVGDSVVVIEAGALPAEVRPWRSCVYVYVQEVDTVFTRAIELGAEALASVEDKPYQERQGAFLDAAGNTWWVATYNSQCVSSAEMTPNPSIERTAAHFER